MALATSFIHASVHASFHEFWSFLALSCNLLLHFPFVEYFEAWLVHTAKLMQAVGYECREPLIPHSLLSVVPQDLLLADLQEPRAESAPRRPSCIIIGRHLDTPSEVPVVCRQLTGTLLLSDCCQQLRIRYNGSEVAPSDFEAAAGCNKGKNWKVPNPEL